ncbi:MAG: hypothetical protein V1880_01335 [Patescibacteria group bacterium]
MPILDNGELSPEKIKAKQQHEATLKKLHQAFNKGATRITDLAKRKLAEIPESNKQARNAAHQEQKEALDQRLVEYSAEVSKANRVFMTTIEHLDKKKDDGMLKDLMSEL